MPDVEDTSLIPKQEDFREASSGSSADSTGENDAEAEVDGSVSLPPVIPQKRKGGRKPIYATSEERKQRNRQAQAAFRERRTEYIKQLEATIKRQEESLQTLQQSHRTAADECLMLRYKNSLLERILLEKGIDVQAELRRKEIPPPTRLPQNLPQPIPISRVTARGKHHSRLSAGSGSTMPKTMQSPGGVSTQSSSMSSPVKSPIFGGSGMMNMPTGFQSPQSTQSMQSRTGGRSSLKPIAPNPVPTIGPGHWPSPFQSHNEQLEQEYGNAEMIDVEEPAEEVDQGPGPYPQPFPQQSYSMAPPGYAMPTTSSDEAGQRAFGNQGYDTNTPMMDTDPFGLSASMHFPTPFSYQEGARRK